MRSWMAAAILAEKLAAGTPKSSQIDAAKTSGVMTVSADQSLSDCIMREGVSPDTFHMKVSFKRK